MSKFELRKAISDLKVNEPYSLKGKRPGFAKPERNRTNHSSHSLVDKNRVPEVELASDLIESGLCEPKDKLTTGHVNLSLYRPDVERTSGSTDLRSAAKSKLSTNEGTNLSSNQPEVDLTSGRNTLGSKQPGVTIPCRQSNPGLIQPEVKSTSGGGRNFIIPHELFEYCQQVVTTKKELIIFNCLLRYTLGFHRSQCEASLSFISDWTKIKDKRNISKTLKRLLSRNLITIASEYDSRTLKSTVYRIPIVEEYLKKNKPGDVSTRGREDLGLKQPHTRGQIKPTPEVDLTPKKENSNKKLNKTLSPELESYFAKLPRRKCDSEQNFLDELLEKFSVEKITQAFLWLEKHGVPKSGEPVHSPFAFLSSAIDGVLSHVEKEKTKEAEELRLKQQIIASEEKKKEDEKANELLWKASKLEFEKAFPEPQERAKKESELIAQNQFLRHVPHEVARKIAIENWFEENS